MTILLDLPDETVAAMIQKAKEEGDTAEGLAARALTYLFGGQTEPAPLGTPADFGSDAAYVAAAVGRARAFGMDAETAAGIAAGIADAHAGRTMTVEESRAAVRAALKSRTAERPSGAK
jgi:hypothetical protein